MDLVLMYDTASKEPLDVIRANECEGDGNLATYRFQALWNEIERLREIVASYQSRFPST